MTNQELSEIIERIAANKASADDLRKYDAWCNAMQDVPGAELPSNFDEKQQHMWERIQHTIDRPNRTGKIWFPAAAACIIILVITGTFAWKHYKSIPALQGNAVQHLADIAPGKHTGTLTLANGKQVLLSDISQGELLNEDGARISKTTDSTLVYQADIGSNGAPSLSYNILSTANAQQYQLTLPDGTKVWVNAATSLKFPVSFKGMANREVILDGEAYFEVAERVQQPFIVKTRGQEVRVLGTHFNINSYTDEPFVKTTLLQGAVKINEQVILKPGEQASSNNDGELSVSKVNATATIAWKDGYFDFTDEDIYQIMRVLSRWYDVSVIYEGTIPGDKMSGRIRKYENASKVLDMVERTGLLRFKIEGKKIIVMKY